MAGLLHAARAGLHQVTDTCALQSLRPNCHATGRGACFQRPPAGSARPQLNSEPTTPCLQVGAIIGKGGQVITELKSCLSVEIRISDKHDLLPGTNDRKVTITGPADMVPIAQTVILKKISQSSESQ